MSDYVLAIPEEVYERARQIADQTSQPVEQVMIAHLRTLAAPIPELSPDEEAELDAIQHLSDDALWTIAQEQMPTDAQAQMQVLMDKNSSGSLDTRERSELARLVERGQRLLVRKSEAAARLTRRGYQVTPKDMTARG